MNKELQDMIAEDSAPEEKGGDLKRVVGLAELMSAQSDAVADLEAKLKEAKADLLRLEREDLPTLMEEIGLNEIVLSDGRHVRVKKDCSASITAKTQDRAFAWLIKNNFGGLIKTQVAVEFANGMHEEAVDVCDELAQRYENVGLVEKVHPATLKAFVKERLETGEEIPFDLFNVYPYSKATITKK